MEDFDFPRRKQRNDSLGKKDAKRRESSFIAIKYAVLYTKDEYLDLVLQISRKLLYLCCQDSEQICILALWIFF